MPPCTVFDLHCDTLTAFMDPIRCPDTLNDPASAFALGRIPPGVRWCQCCAVFIPDGLTAEEAWGYYRFHRDRFFRQMERLSPCACPCRTAGDVEQAWAAGKTALILTVENASFLGDDLRRAEELRRDGVRIASLTWNGPNALGSGHETEEGLSAPGREAVAVLEDCGILLDVSHLNDAGLRDVLDVARRPFLATHSNARAVCPHRRNLTDEQLKALIVRGCLVGLNYYSPFLRARGEAGFADLLDHARHILELGGTYSLGLGSDFDGAELPPCLDTCTKVPELGVFLARSLGRETAERILWRNALAFFQKNGAPLLRSAPPRAILGQRGDCHAGCAGQAGVSVRLPGGQPH